MANPIDAIKELLSPLLILLCFALILYGIFAAQVYGYWVTYDEDSKPLRGFVMTLLFLETVHTGFCMHVLYWYFIINLGTPANALNIVWSVGASIVLEIIIIAMVQSFYIYRVWKLSGKILVAIVPAILLVIRIGIGMTTTSFLFTLHEWPEFQSVQYSKILMNIGLVLASIVDISITVLLTYQLNKHKSAADFQRTQHLVQKLMFYTINTGAFTMVCGVASLLMFNFLTTNLMFGGMLEILSKLYANSLLGMLNARNHLKSEYTSTNGGGANTIPLHIRSNRSINIRGMGTRTHDAMDGVRVDIHKELVTDISPPSRSRDSASGKGEYPFDGVRD